MNESYDKLLTRIRQTIGDPPKPRITIRLAALIDGEWGLPEPYATSARKEDSYYTHWWEVDKYDLTAFRNLIFLEPDGYLFYIPAYMSYAIWCWQEGRERFWDYSIDLDISCDIRRKNCSIFNDDQRETIIHFLELCVSLEGKDVEVTEVLNLWKSWRTSSK